MSSVAAILQALAENAGQAKLRRGALVGNAVSEAGQVPAQILADRDASARLARQQAIQDERLGFERSKNARDEAERVRADSEQARKDAAQGEVQKRQDALRKSIEVGFQADPNKFDLAAASTTARDEGYPDLIPTLAETHKKLTPEPKKTREVTTVGPDGQPIIKIVDDVSGQEFPVVPKAKEAPTVGTFEDYVVRKFGQNPTPGQIESARQSYAEAGSTKEPDVAVSLSPEGLALTAHQYAMTGQLPPMGMGKQGAAVRTNIINEAAKIYKGLDLPSQVAAFNANKGSLAKLQQQRDAIGSFEQTAQKNIDMFLEQAGKVVDTGSPIANALLRQVNGKLLGSPDQAAYDASKQVAINEIAKITSNPTLAGQLSDTARKEVEAFNPAGATLKQTVNVMRLLKQDMNNRTKALDDQIGDIQRRIATPPGQSATPATAAPSTPQAATSGPKVGERRMIKGQLGEWDGKGWKPVISR